ncbi:hypothetical protein NDU88_000717 [Pleurodeles waltl]|uniref:Uncharacterized protein n=1 Tax=Pleurodeles waltl TaxID=8319 RepID=A0AAV7LAP8_PLEWA|nr:hypothetical protein NDU88_000717 [Pleurodeles waltl]
MNILNPYSKSFIYGDLDLYPALYDPTSVFIFRFGIRMRRAAAGVTCPAQAPRMRRAPRRCGFPLPAHPHSSARPRVAARGSPRPQGIDSSGLNEPP